MFVPECTPPLTLTTAALPEASLEGEPAGWFGEITYTEGGAVEYAFPSVSGTQSGALYAAIVPTDAGGAPKGGWEKNSPLLVHFTGGRAGHKESREFSGGRVGVGQGVQLCLQGCPLVIGVHGKTAV